jgi:hypothetical protein
LLAIPRDLKGDLMPMIRRISVAAVASLALASGGALAAAAQGGYAKPADSPKSAPAKTTQHKEHMKPAVGAAIDAKLVDPEQKAQKKAATVTVKVTGVAMIDPATVGEKPKAGQGHLHYQVDDGPIIATTATKLSFHELKPGPHRIEVVLAANDHNPLGLKATLNVTVPAGMDTNAH